MVGGRVCVGGGGGRGRQCTRVAGSRVHVARLAPSNHDVGPVPEDAVPGLQRVTPPQHQVHLLEQPQHGVRHGGCRGPGGWGQGAGVCMARCSMTRCSRECVRECVSEGRGRGLGVITVEGGGVTSALKPSVAVVTGGRGGFQEGTLQSKHRRVRVRGG